MTGTIPTGDPPPTFPQGTDSSGSVSPAFIQRKVVVAELLEIRASRARRGCSAELIDDIEAALEEAVQSPPDAAEPQGWSHHLMCMPYLRRMPSVQGWRKQKAREERERTWNDTSIRPPQCGLVGLALSGGGIRSATVCLGVLQELARYRVLRLVDYLSTVSGGGYIGASWSGVLARSPVHRKLVPSPDFPFIHQTDPNDPNGEVVEAARHRQNKEPIALVHVRNLAIHLVPRGLRDWMEVLVLLLLSLVVSFLRILPALLILCAVALWAYGDAIGSGEPERLPGLIGTSWLIVVCFAYLVLATTLQVGRSWSWLRKVIDRLLGQPERNGWRVRRNLLRFGALLLLVLVAVAAFEATQYPIMWLAEEEQAAPIVQHELNASLSLDWSELLLSGEFWSILAAVTAVVSTLASAASAVVSRHAAGSHSKSRRIAVAVIGVLVLVALLYIYAWSALFLTVFAVDDYGTLGLLLGRDMAGYYYDYRTWAIFYVAAAIILWLILTLIVDVNKLSLHGYYRDRLSRPFMFRLEPVHAEGARTDAKPAYWRTRHEDDIWLSALRPSSTGGPYHLINAVVDSPDSSKEGRAGRANFFVFSPRFCGNERLGYCQTARLERKDPNMNLATAMAVSAAAVAPDLGQKTSNHFLTFAMSMLNIRFGYWLHKPESIEQRDLIRWPVGPLYFLRHLIGLPIRRSAYVYLSDGDHLDNTGIFELLRRRCRYIIAIDAEADPGVRFNGLATLQRLAWIDLGVAIDFDVEDMRPDAEGLCRRHFALCHVIYGRDSRGVPTATGKLLYIKSSLTGTEVEYVKEYWRCNPTFPHETTGEESFDETQFEAYRALGQKMGHEVVERVEEADLAGAAAFFAHLENWLQPVMPLGKDLVDLVNRRRSIDERLRAGGFADYYNEIWQTYNGEDATGLHESHAQFASQAEPLWEPGETPKPHILQLVDEQIHLMERAFLQLRLDDPAHWNHPRNRGWRETFARWSQSPTFRKYWQLLIPSYSRGLEAFGVNVLRLPEPLHRGAEAK